MSEVKLQAVRGHKYTCATVQGNSTYENRCDCGALDSAGSAIPDHSWEMAHLQRQLSAAQAERERLALAICGGEDAPGYANSQTVETLELLAKQNERDHSALVDRFIDVERQLSEAVERAERAEGRAKDFEEQAAICAKVTEGAEAEIARLREALEPFARVAEFDIGESETDEDIFRPMDGRYAVAGLIRVGHLRAARAALQGELAKALTATCPDCDGHGIMHGYDADCPTCGGSGRVALINTKEAGNG